MSESPSSDPWGHNPPTSDGTWQAPPPPPPYAPPYQPTGSEPSYPPVQPTQPYSPVQPAQAETQYQPYGAPQPTAQFDPAQPSGQFPPYGAVPTYGQPAWQQPPAPKKSRTGLIITLVIVVVALICVGGVVAVALSGKSDKDNATTTSTSGTGGTKTTPKPTVVAIAPGDGTTLESYIVKPPSGAKTYPVDNSSKGVQTLEQFVKNDFPDSSNELGILQTRGFKVVAETDWSGKDGIEVDTQLIQFGDSDGALSHINGQHGAYLDSADVTDSYSLPGLENSYGYEQSKIDSSGNRTVTLMSPIGSIVVLIEIYTPGQFDRAAELAFMTKQLAALTPK